MTNIILASASPRRRELLQNAGVIFEVRPGNGEENITKELPWEIVEELSMLKAYQAAELQTDAPEGTVILGADTLVASGSQILGKPVDEEDAVRMLTMLQGNTHQVYTGVTILQKREERYLSYSFHECTEVTFYPVTQAEIRSYVRSGEPMDKAGSYGIQGVWGIYVKKINGDYNNVVGLPVARLFWEAKQMGICLKEESIQ